jgi:hypothetical protein
MIDVVTGVVIFTVGYVFGVLVRCFSDWRWRR